MARAERIFKPPIVLEVCHITTIIYTQLRNNRINIKSNVRHERMKKQRIPNASEQQTDEVLRSSFAVTGYRIFARLPLAKIIQREYGETLSKKDRNFLETSELDFVVANADTIPEFAVEFDGPHHQLVDKQIEPDARKNKLCDLAKLPLLRITDTELEKFDKYTILEFIAMRFLTWQNESKEIEQDIAEYVETFDERQRQELLDGCIADPSIDPAFHFDLKHPFPRTRELAKRLLTEHGVVSLLAEPFLKSMTSPHTYKLFCDVSRRQWRFEGHDLIVRCDYVISRSTEPFFGVKTIASEQDRSTSTLLKLGAVEFRIRCTLPIDPDYDPSEAPIDYFSRTGKFPVSFQELPGVDAFDIAENMSKYLGLREVEKWMEHNKPQ
jgi:hypothetical protein